MFCYSDVRMLTWTTTFLRQLFSRKHANWMRHAELAARILHLESSILFIESLQELFASANVHVLA